MTDQNVSQDVDEMVQSRKPSALALAGAILAVVVSSVIAFCCTCVSIGGVAFVMLYSDMPDGVKSVYGFGLYGAAYYLGAFAALLVGWIVAEKFKANFRFLVASKEKE